MKPPILLALLVWASASAAQAQSIEDRLREQLVAVTAQLRDLQAKQAAQSGAQADTTQLKAQLAAAQAEIRSLKRRPAAGPAKADTAPLKAQIAILGQAKTAAETALAAERTQLAKANETAEQLQISAEQTSAAQATAARDLEVCRAKSVQALQVARYVLRAYEHVTVADVLARKEPVSGLARARIEQIEQTYADQIYQSRLDAKPPASPSTPTAASPKP